MLPQPRRRGDWRLTAHISARTPTCQHAGTVRLRRAGRGLPAAEHFIPPGALHVFVRRQSTTSPLLRVAAISVTKALDVIDVSGPRSRKAGRLEAANTELDTGYG